MHPPSAEPFIYEGNVVRYNSKRGVPYDAPLLVGSRKKVGDKHDRAYRPTHFIFQAKNGAVAAGTDEHNQWKHLGDNTATFGHGNRNEDANSVVSGHRNSVTSKSRHSGNNTILASSNSKITNSKNSAIVASDGVEIRSGQRVAVIGLDRKLVQSALCNMSNALLTSKLFALEKVNIGPIPEGVLDNAVLSVYGDSVLHGNVKAGTITARNLVVESAEITDLRSGSLYIASSGGETGTTVIIRPEDQYDIIYVNTIGGLLRLQLGENAADIFRENQRITIKDVNPEFGNEPSYNADIIVPDGDVRIEFYNADGFLTAGVNAGYALDTGGGAVTFRYSNFGIPGSFPTWVIESQFMGNPRGDLGPVDPIEPASNSVRNQVLNRH